MDENPKTNELWHVRLKGGSTLMTVIVREVTAKTVLIEENTRWSSPERYVRGDVSFIEKCK